MTVTKLGRICIDDLNELADQVYAGCTLISRRPSTPSFWFYGLAIDGKAHTWGESLRSLLSEQAKALLELVDVGEFASARDYCSCVDDSLWLTLTLRARPDLRTYRGRAVEPCYACAFGAHDRCSAGGCLQHGEIHFPETIIDPRVKAAA